jgi:hypothetical protein
MRFSGARPHTPGARVAGYWLKATVIIEEERKRTSYAYTHIVGAVNPLPRDQCLIGLTTPESPHAPRAPHRTDSKPKIPMIETDMIRK